MKQINVVILFFVFVLLGTSVNGQNNVVKLGLGSLTRGNLNLKYERALTEKTSIQLAFAYDIPSKFTFGPFIKLLEDVGVNDDFTNITKSGVKFLPEFRYYLGDSEALRGIYIGLYGKYSNYKLSSSGEVTAQNIPTEVIVLYSNVGLGGMIGVQWIISDRFTIDWNIGGLGYNLSAARIGFNSDDPLTISSEKIHSTFEDVKENLDIVAFDEWTQNQIDKLADASESITAKDSYQSGRIPFSVLDTRIGLTIGYAF